MKQHNLSQIVEDFKKGNSVCFARFFSLAHAIKIRKPYFTDQARANYCKLSLSVHMGS